MIAINTNTSYFQNRSQGVRSLMLGLGPVRYYQTMEYNINFMNSRSAGGRKSAASRLAQAPGSVLTSEDTTSKTTVTQPAQPISRRKTVVSSLFGAMTTTLIGLSMVLGLFLFAPGLYTFLVPQEPVPVEATESGSALGGSFDEGAIAFDDQHNQTETNENGESESEGRYEPPKNETLPEGSWISIPKIGVRTQLQWESDPNMALDTGVWAVPEYGQPGDLGVPMIAAAHRFGYKWMWEGDYWKYHTFYMLPDIQPGDVVEVIHDQRKYVYEVYDGELNQEITDYEADLILYTCRFMTGEDRHIRYARLINPEADTQLSAAR